MLERELRHVTRGVDVLLRQQAAEIVRRNEAVSVVRDTGEPRTIQAGQCDDAVGWERGLGRHLERALLKAEGDGTQPQLDVAKLEELGLVKAAVNA